MEQYRCPSCMRPITSPVCPYCGFPEHQPNESHQLPVGTMLRGRYQIGRVLGQGGFGITYLGWDTLLENKIAIKEYYPNGMVTRSCTQSLEVQCCTDRYDTFYFSCRARFLREAKALAMFKDIPEIVDILDLFEEYNTAYIIMEYVQGMNLASYIQHQNGRLSPEETLRILKPVMEALSTVHRAGIVHRDISPDNIMLHPTGGAKLLDFGALRAVSDAQVGKPLTSSTESILKHGFAPIEQYQARGNLGPWTDEYAMCATIYYCLTGRIPPDAPSRTAEGLDLDWESIPDLSPAQRGTLQKGSSVRAADRYPNMDSFIVDLFSSENDYLNCNPGEDILYAPTYIPAQQDSFNSILTDSNCEATPGKSDGVILHQDRRNPTISDEVTSPIVSGNEMRDGQDARKESKSEDPIQKNGRTKNKRKFIFTITAIAIAALILLTAKIILPEVRYNQAEKLLTAGQYEEAIALFKALDGYKDANERIAQANILWYIDIYGEDIYDKYGVLEPDVLAYINTYGQDFYDKYGFLDAEILAYIHTYGQDIYDKYGILDGKALDFIGIYGQTAYDKFGLVEEGSYITFGAYEQDNDQYNGMESIEWLVLTIEDGKALLVSKYALDCQPFGVLTEVHRRDTWENSALRTWLNQDFLNAAFTAEDQAFIPTVTISEDTGVGYYQSRSNATRDKVFILSIQEARDYFISDSARQCTPTAFAKSRNASIDENGFCWWWLRSPGYSGWRSSFISSDGSINEEGGRLDFDSGANQYGYYGYVKEEAVRPALWITLKH